MLQHSEEVVVTAVRDIWRLGVEVDEGSLESRMSSKSVGKEGSPICGVLDEALVAPGGEQSWKPVVQASRSSSVAIAVAHRDASMR